MLTGSSSNLAAVAGTVAASQKSAGATSGVLLGLGLATWMEFYTYDGVNLVLPDIAGTFGVSRDQASWILTTYISARCSVCAVNLDGRPCRISPLHHRVHGCLRSCFCRLRRHTSRKP